MLNIAVDVFLPAIILSNELVATGFRMSPLGVIKDFVEKN